QPTERPGRTDAEWILTEKTLTFASGFFSRVKGWPCGILFLHDRRTVFRISAATTGGFGIVPVGALAEDKRPSEGALREVPAPPLLEPPRAEPQPPAPARRRFWISCGVLLRACRP